tara:strand:- start:7 stop:912 length:906 start_codon:yes stop_codon:yes gene_type:complete
LQLISENKLDYSIYDKKPINSPFRWAGGKFYARKLINAYIPEHDLYLEPFAGGGSIFFYKEKKETFLNDLDKDLINCYKTIQNNIFDLIDFLKDEIATKERHKYYRNNFKPKNDLERAAKYYYLNRTSYSGIMKLENCYWGYGEKYSMRPENWPRQLIKNHIKLQNCKLLSLDFEEVFRLIPNNRNIFVFIDPPYFNADQNKFYSCSFSTNDHYRLAESLKKYQKKIKFLLTYDDSEEIRELYGWTKNIEKKEWNYTISRTDDQANKKKLADGFKSSRDKGKEIFICNYDLPTEPKQLNFL